MRVRRALFLSLLFTSLLSVVGHQRGREGKESKKNYDIMHAFNGEQERKNYTIELSTGKHRRCLGRDKNEGEEGLEGGTLRVLLCSTTLLDWTLRPDLSSPLLNAD